MEEQVLKPQAMATAQSELPLSNKFAFITGGLEAEFTGGEGTGREAMG